MRLLALTAATLLLAPAGTARAQRPPVIDMHVHSGQQPLTVVATHDSLNVRFAVVSALQSDMRTWANADTGRFYLGLLFPCDRGRMPNTGLACFENGADFPDTTWLRAELRAGRLRERPSHGTVLASRRGVRPAGRHPYGTRTASSCI